MKQKKEKRKKKGGDETQGGDTRGIEQLRLLTLVLNRGKVQLSLLVLVK